MADADENELYAAFDWLPARHQRIERKLAQRGTGHPAPVQTHAGDVGDASTAADQVEKLRERFGLTRVVLAGDPGVLTQARIEELKKGPQQVWISALRSEAIQSLVEQGVVQLSLFDEQNLAEITSDAYPGERLVVCHNPLLAQDRQRTREELLDAIEKELARIANEAGRRTKTRFKADEIGLKVSRARDTSGNGRLPVGVKRRCLSAGTVGD